MVFPTRLIFLKTKDLLKLLIDDHYYRPQTMFGKVMFLHVSVCPGGWYPSMPCRSPGRRGSPGPHLGGRLRVWLGRGGLQAHTQGGLQAHTWGVSRPTPGGVSRPTPGGSPGQHQGGSSGPHLGGHPSIHWGRPPPPLTATAAGGTHPTGMHSCKTLISCSCFGQKLCEIISSRIPLPLGNPGSATVY